MGWGEGEGTLGTGRKRGVPSSGPTVSSVARAGSAQAVSEARTVDSVLRARGVPLFQSWGWALETSAVPRQPPVSGVLTPELGGPREGMIQ